MPTRDESWNGGSTNFQVRLAGGLSMQWSFLAVAREALRARFSGQSSAHFQGSVRVMLNLVFLVLLPVGIAGFVCLLYFD